MSIISRMRMKLKCDIYYSMTLLIPEPLFCNMCCFSLLMGQFEAFQILFNQPHLACETFNLSEWKTMKSYEKQLDKLHSCTTSQKKDNSTATFCQVAFRLGNTKLLFMNNHLAAHAEKMKARDQSSHLMNCNIKSTWLIGPTGPCYLLVNVATDW